MVDATWHPATVTGSHVPWGMDRGRGVHPSGAGSDKGFNRSFGLARTSCVFIALCVCVAWMWVWTWGQARWQSPEYREKMKTKMRGSPSPHTEETKRKISETLKRKWREDSEYRARVRHSSPHLPSPTFITSFMVHGRSHHTRTTPLLRRGPRSQPRCELVGPTRSSGSRCPRRHGGL